MLLLATFAATKFEGRLSEHVLPSTGFDRGHAVRVNLQNGRRQEPTGPSNFCILRSAKRSAPSVQSLLGLVGSAVVQFLQA